MIYLLWLSSVFRSLPWPSSGCCIKLLKNKSKSIQKTSQMKCIFCVQFYLCF